MILVLISVVFLVLCILVISIKIWTKKDGKFAGTCASQNPLLNKTNEPCGFCGKTPDQFKDCDVKN
ncbi:MAG TPA: membrane or secreted protein [Flavobacteriaceae bacterium]|nr:membrane or secreted protein [Flavobacteriaceae bacterium]